MERKFRVRHCLKIILLFCCFSFSFLAFSWDRVPPAPFMITLFRLISFTLVFRSLWGRCGSPFTSGGRAHTVSANRQEDRVFLGHPNLLSHSSPEFGFALNVLFFFWGAGDGTQGLRHGRYVLSVPEPHLCTPGFYIPNWRIPSHASPEVSIRCQFCSTPGAWGGADTRYDY